MKRDFDALAAAWDEEPRRVALAREVAEAILAVAGASASGRVLDFGCGTGLLTLFLAPYARAIDGVDSSAGMIAVLAEKISAGELGKVRAIHWEGDGCLPPGSGTYDLVVTNMTMHHVADVPALLGVLVSVLAPGGMICIADLDAEDGTFHDDPTGIEHNGFERDVMERWMKEAGLVSLSARTAATVRKARGDVAHDYTVFLCSGTKPQ